MPVNPERVSLFTVWGTFPRLPLTFCFSIKVRENMFNGAVFAKACSKGCAHPAPASGIHSDNESHTIPHCAAQKRPRELFLWCRIKASRSKYNKTNISCSFITEPTSGGETSFSCSRNHRGIVVMFWETEEEQ